MTHATALRPVRASLAATVIAGGCALLAGLTGCATPGSPTAAAPRPAISPQAVTTSPQAVPVNPQAAAVDPPAVVSAPVTAPSSANPTSDPTTAPATPASPSAISAPTPTEPTDSVVNAPVSAATAPHFATPDAAMRYLVTAYNSSNETAIRHVTTPDSRTQFEAERQWVQTFRFRDCTANGAPTWDYACVLDIVATVPGVDAGIDPATGLPVMNEVTVLVAPAARTGYYLAANEGCGGG